MVLLPGETPPTVKAIYEAYEASERQAPRRQHLGASEVGQSCNRALWYGFRWAYRSEFSGRMLRLFNTGHREESRIVSDLRRVGVELLEKDPATGRQWSWCDEVVGDHFRGSCDGALRGLLGYDCEWFLAEFKTINAKGYKRLKHTTNGGVRAVNPRHWYQMQTYMGWSGLRRAAYFVVCKDNDAIYMEIVEFDETAFKQISEQARHVITTSQPLAKIGNSVNDPSCMFCDARHVCHENQVADVNCRTCTHSTPVVDEPGGKWMCERHGVFLTSLEQQRACDDHLFIPPLVPFADAKDGGEDWVLYQIRRKDGKGAEFYNTASTGFPSGSGARMSSAQIHKATPEDFGESGGTVDDWDLFPSKGGT